MTVSGAWEIFLAGAAGGVFVELLRWWKLRESPIIPDHARSLLYWSVTLLMIVAGGVLAVLYGTSDPKNVLMVVNVGASAPALIGALATASPAADPPAKRRVRSGGPLKSSDQDVKPADRLRHILTFGS